MLRSCANLKAIRYESTSLNRIVADKSHRVIVALTLDLVEPGQTLTTQLQSLHQGKGTIIPRDQSKTFLYRRIKFIFKMVT